MFDFVKFLRKSLIISAGIMLVGVILTCIFGVDFDITFIGGSRFTYSYSGDVDNDSVSNAVKDNLGVVPIISKSSDYSNTSQKLVITFSGDITSEISSETLEKLTSEETDTDNTSSGDSEAADTESTENENTETMVAVQNAITKVLNDNFPDNSFTLSESNAINPTLAGSFFIKSLFAVLLAAILVIVYIGVRFRKIGGITAGVSALIALIHDVAIAFFVCVIFRLDIDTNFFAVVLTLFGYSLNDTIIIFDRVRENKKYFPALTVREQVNKSINETLARSIVTSLTTFAAIMAVVIVAEFFGVSTLRSFAIPMAVGILSGCYSTLFLAGPIWVKWSEHRASKKAIK